MTEYRQIKVTDIRKGMKRPYWDYVKGNEAFHAIVWWDVTNANEYLIHFDDGHFESRNGGDRISIVDDGQSDRSLPKTKTVGIHNLRPGMKYVYGMRSDGPLSQTVVLAERLVYSDDSTSYLFTFDDGSRINHCLGSTVTVLDE
ncbi:MAG TPA: hypothetical protein VIY48_14100 [Candidatus Paceibacterota bacterium]